MEIEDEVEFADIAEIFVEDLNKALHEFEDNELVLIFIDDGYEVEAGEPLIDYLVLFVI